MKTRMLVTALVCLIVSAALLAQTATINWVYGYAGSRAVWWQLGPSFVVTGNVIDVKAPPPPPSVVRVIGEKIAYDTAAAGWKVPAGAKNLEVWVNGLHYWPVTDYTDNGGVLKAAGASMLPEFDVRFSYEK